MGDSPVSCHWPFEKIPAPLWESIGKYVPPLGTSCRYFSECTCCKGNDRGKVEAQTKREAVWLDGLDLLRCVEMPLLVFSGTEDSVCPPDQVKGLFEASVSGRKRMVMIEGVDHSEITKSLQYWSE